MVIYTTSGNGATFYWIKWEIFPHCLIEGRRAAGGDAVFNYEFLVRDRRAKDAKAAKGRGTTAPNRTKPDQTGPEIAKI